MESELLMERARGLQGAAHGLVGALQIMDRLRPVGTPTLVGAVRTGLMVDPDIDIVVHASGRPDIAAVFAMLEALALREELVEVIFFANKLRQPYQGLALDIGCRFDGGGWQLNIAIFGADCPHRHVMRQTSEAMIAALDAPTRRTILAIKAERRLHLGPFQGGESHVGCESLDLYRAVFDGGAASYDQAVAWIAGHPRQGPFAGWVPEQRGMR